jgi:hypothetical protein
LAARLLLEFLGQQLPHLLTGLLVLLLHLPPEILQVALSFRVGDVLVVPPDIVDAGVEDLDQVVDAICYRAGLADVLRRARKSPRCAGLEISHVKN